MADGVTIELPIDRLNAVIARLSARLDNMRPAWEGVGRYLRSQVQLGFRKQQTPGGEPWLPTRRGGAILRLTSRLRDSIDYEASADQVALGTNVRYAAVHQFGATIRPKRPGGWLRWQEGGEWRRAREVTIPARPYLPLPTLPQSWTDGVIRVLEGFVSS